MSPLVYFEAVWARCDQLSALHAYLSNNVTGVLQPEELLRAEWVARVCAVDLYVHELVAQKMLETFDGHRAPTPAYLRFQISAETTHRIRTSVTPSDASAAFDLEIREKLSYVTYQDPEKIADGIRLISPMELWNEVAMHLGSTAATKSNDAKNLKTQISLVARRRNQIAHEGDLQPTHPRMPWPITKSALAYVAELLERTVRAIDSVI